MRRPIPALLGLVCALTGALLVTLALLSRSERRYLDERIKSDSLDRQLVSAQLELRETVEVCSEAWLAAPISKKEREVIHD